MASLDTLLDIQLVTAQMAGRGKAIAFWYVVWVLALGAAVTGCIGSADRPGGIVWDSAGAVVIDHGRIDLDTLPQWTLSAEPHVIVGTVVGAAEYQFNRIRDVRRVRDGAIAVIDASHTLRLFDAGGRYLWTAGGEGDGPAEFRAPYIVREVGPDSLVVWDARPNRLSIFTAGGQFVRAATLWSVSGNSAAWGMSGPRSLLIEFRRLERVTVEGHPALVHPSDFYIVDLDGRVTRELGRRPFVTNFQEVDENGAYSPAMFATSAAIASAPSGLWYGNAKDAELRLEIGPDQPRRIVRWETPDRTVTGSDVEALLASWRSEWADDPSLLRFLEAYGRSHPRAEKFPPYEKIVVDRLGRLWVQEFVRQHQDDGRRRWIVFSADEARILARVTHRAELELYDIGADWALVVEQNQLDVESVRLYTFTAR